MDTHDFYKIDKKEMILKNERLEIIKERLAIAYKRWEELEALN